MGVINLATSTKYVLDGYPKWYGFFRPKKLNWTVYFLIVAVRVRVLFGLEMLRISLENCFLFNKI